MALSKIELLRYSKHIKLRSVGISGQESLKTAKVLVIGAGNLGCIVLQYLTAAGIGTIGIIDGAIIEESNLQSQILFTPDDLSSPKAKTAALKLKVQNPNVNFKVANTAVTKDNILQLMESFNIVVDCTDNSLTHCLINDACILTNKPMVFGSMNKFDGQVSVFNYENGPSYRCLFQDALNTANNSGAGVLCVLPGIIGSIQANEVLKMILNIGTILSAKTLIVNTLSYQQSIIEFNKTDKANITELGTYTQNNNSTPLSLPSNITALQLNEMLKATTELNILDVREYFEWDICHINGATNIPMNLIDECIEEVSKTTPTVVVCHHGVRSMNVIHYLQTKGFRNLINLEGGIHAWAIEVDSNMSKY